MPSSSLWRQIWRPTKTTDGFSREAGISAFAGNLVDGLVLGPLISVQLGQELQFLSLDYPGDREDSQLCAPIRSASASTPANPVSGLTFFPAGPPWSS